MDIHNHKMVTNVDRNLLHLAISSIIADMHVPTMQQSILPPELLLLRSSVTIVSLTLRKRSYNINLKIITFNKGLNST